MAEVRRIGWDEIVRHFEELEDPRSSVNRKHPLVSVVVIALLAVLAGAGGPAAIARWAAFKEEFLLQVLDSLSYAVALPRYHEDLAVQESYENLVAL